MLGPWSRSLSWTLSRPCLAPCLAPSSHLVKLSPPGIFRYNHNLVPKLRHCKTIYEPENPPVLTQEAYRPPHSSYSLCCSVSWGVPTLTRGYQPSIWQGMVTYLPADGGYLPWPVVTYLAGGWGSTYSGYLPTPIQGRYPPTRIGTPITWKVGTRHQMEDRYPPPPIRLKVSTPPPFPPMMDKVKILPSLILSNAGSNQWKLIDLPTWWTTSNVSLDKIQRPLSPFRFCRLIIFHSFTNRCQ